jgi:hypothetical protein
MTRKSLSTVLVAAIAVTSLVTSLAISLASSVEAKVRHKRAPAPAADTWNRPAAQQPARMIEVRPGLWISSYGCVTDEGYGRFSPCDLTNKR